MSLTHIVFVDIDPAMEQDFNAWYDEEHLPLLAAVHGFMERKQLRTIKHHAEHMHGS